MEGELLARRQTCRWREDVPMKIAFSPFDPTAALKSFSFSH